jgi:hypothetical protein
MNSVTARNEPSIPSRNESLIKVPKYLKKKTELLVPVIELLVTNTAAAWKSEKLHRPSPSSSSNDSRYV